MKDEGDFFFLREKYNLAPSTTNCLFFGPLRQFVPFKWMKSESRARHVTLLA